MKTVLEAPKKVEGYATDEPYSCGYSEGWNDAINESEAWNRQNSEPVKLSFSCKNRSAEPSNEYAACSVHCGNEETCISTKSAPVDKNIIYQTMTSTFNGWQRHWTDIDKKQYELDKHAGHLTRIVYLAPPQPNFKD